MTRFHAVLGGRVVMLVGQLDPQELLGVLNSLVPPEGS
jgi:hypothetical protein